MQTSSVEIERVCDKADERILETAAVSSQPAGGGPEVLVVFVVLKTGQVVDPNELKSTLSRAIQKNLNPLFKVLPYSLFLVKQFIFIPEILSL